VRSISVGILLRTMLPARPRIHAASGAAERYITTTLFG
jgi:hypothetical protein